MIRRLAAWIRVYATPTLVFLLLTGALFVIAGLGCAFLSLFTVASQLIGAGVTLGAPAYCGLVVRHINPEGHK